MANLIVAAVETVTVTGAVVSAVVVVIVASVVVVVEEGVESASTAVVSFEREIKAGVG